MRFQASLIVISVEARKRVPHEHTLRAEREGGRQTTPVCNPARGDHGNIGGNLDDLRHQHHRADEAAVASRLGPLRDDHVHAALDCLASLSAVHDLLDPQ